MKRLFIDHQNARQARLRVRFQDGLRVRQTTNFDCRQKKRTPGQRFLQSGYPSARAAQGLANLAYRRKQRVTLGAIR